MSVTFLKKEKGRGMQFEVHVKRHDPNNDRKEYRRRMWFQTEAEAKRHERRVEQSILSGEFTKADQRRVREKQESEEAETVREFSKRFIKYCEVEKAESTASGREGHLRNHILPIIGTLPLVGVNTEHLEELKHEVKSKGLQNNTVNRVLETAMAMLSYAEYLKKSSSFPSVKKLDEEEKPIEWLRPLQLQALLSADDEVWRRMMLLDARTGLRRGELRSLHWASVDFVTQQILVQHNAWRDRLKTVTKGKQKRYVPLSAEAVRALKEQKAVSFMRSKFVFPNSEGGLLTDAEMYQTLHFLCRKAGIREYGWHAFRHTFGAHSTMANVHPRLLQKWMGHSSLKMTERYAHLAPEQDEAINRLDELQDQEQYRSNVDEAIAK